MISIKRVKLADSVIEEIQRMMDSGELKEGDKLPNQNELARRLGVSRPSLREALHTLTLIGAIEQKPGRGTIIKARHSIQLADQLAPPLVTDATTTLELMETRRIIEVATAGLAARRATTQEKQALGGLIREMAQAQAAENVQLYTELDISFHVQVARASHNRFLLYQFVTIRGFMEQFMRESFGILPGLLRRSLKYHTDITRAISAGDAKRAAGSMERHIKDIEHGLASYYQVTHAPDE